MKTMSPRNNGGFIFLYMTCAFQGNYLIRNEHTFTKISPRMEYKSIKFILFVFRIFESQSVECLIDVSS